MLRIPSSVPIRRVPLSCSFEAFRGAHGRCRVGEPVRWGLNLKRREFSKRAHPDPGETVVSGRSADGYFFSRQSRVNASSLLEGAVGLKRSAQVVLIGPSDGQLGSVSSCYPSSFFLDLSSAMVSHSSFDVHARRVHRVVLPSIPSWCFAVFGWLVLDGVRCGDYPILGGTRRYSLGFRTSLGDELRGWVSRSRPWDGRWFRTASWVLAPPPPNTPTPLSIPRTGESLPLRSLVWGWATPSPTCPFPTQQERPTVCATNAGGVARRGSGLPEANTKDSPSKRGLLCHRGGTAAVCGATAWKHSWKTSTRTTRRRT